MKKIISILSLLVMSSSAAFAQDVVKELKYDQQEALTTFIDSWLKPEARSIVEAKFRRLVQVDAWLRNALGSRSTGVFTDVSKAVDVLTRDGDRDSLNLFAVVYFEKNDGIVIDTRSVFSSKPYRVK